MLIEVKVKVSRLIDAKVKKLTETYVLDTQFFTQAEYAVTQLLEKDLKEDGGTVEDYDIQSLKLSQIKEIDEPSFHPERNSFIATLRDSWTLDDGTVKHIKYKVLLWAEDLTKANQRVQDLAKEGYDMLIEGIKQVDYEYLDNSEVDTLRT